MNQVEDSDEWLMNQVVAGRRESLAPLVRRYASSLLTFIYRMTGDRAHSEELFQEVFLSVWLKRAQYQFPRTFRSWLFAIAANRCRADYRRRRPRDVPIDGEELRLPASNGPTPHQSAVATETAAMIATAVEQLPSHQRTVVVLRVWNAQSYAEIADVLECRESTARVHMHQALASLRKFLEPRLGEME